MNTPTPTESEIADIYNSIRCAWEQCEMIYGEKSESIARVLKYWVKCEKELKAAREEIKELNDKLDDAVADSTNAVNDIIRMKWQRDTLAEALDKIKQSEPANHNGDLFYPRYTEDGDYAGDEPVNPLSLLAFIYPTATEALQSLTTTEP